MYFSLLGATVISDNDTVVPAMVEYLKPTSLILSRITEVLRVDHLQRSDQRFLFNKEFLVPSSSIPW